jgi:hypothetical protein
MSDNSDAIQRALRRRFPSAVTGNCLFHLQQNFKKKRTIWNVQVLQPVPVNARSKRAVGRRDENESFARDAVNLLSSLQHVHEFNLCSENFPSYLESQGDIQFANILRRELFADGETGWGRSMMPNGSASTNNSSEAFNGNVLSRDIV